jgi:hypothetical protein
VSSSLGGQSRIAPIRCLLLKHTRDAFVDQATLDACRWTHGFLGLPDYEPAPAEYRATLAVLAR